MGGRQEALSMTPKASCTLLLLCEHYFDFTLIEEEVEGANDVLPENTTLK
jgi:hypothetical protein